MTKGTVKSLLDQIIRKRAAGNPTIEMTTRTKLILKGLDPDNFNLFTPDDPAVIARVRAVATEMGVAL